MHFKYFFILAVDKYSFFPCMFIFYRFVKIKDSMYGYCKKMRVLFRDNRYFYLLKVRIFHFTT